MLNEAEGKAIKLAKDVASLGSQLQDTQVSIGPRHLEAPGVRPSWGWAPGLLRVLSVGAASRRNPAETQRVHQAAPAGRREEQPAGTAGRGDGGQAEPGAPHLNPEHPFFSSLLSVSWTSSQNFFSVATLTIHIN